MASIVNFGNGQSILDPPGGCSRPTERSPEHRAAAARPAAPGPPWSTAPASQPASQPVAPPRSRAAHQHTKIVNQAWAPQPRSAGGTSCTLYGWWSEWGWGKRSKRTDISVSWYHDQPPYLHPHPHNGGSAAQANTHARALSPAPGAAPSAACGTCSGTFVCVLFVFDETYISVTQHTPHTSLSGRLVLKKLVNLSQPRVLLLIMMLLFRRWYLASVGAATMLSMMRSSSATCSASHC
jgi:hypothetical protein